MSKKTSIYMYGMTVMSTIHRLAGPYPAEDSYQEVAATYHVPGGETGNGAIVLASLGHDVTIAGPHLGRRSRDGILQYMRRYGINTRYLHYDESYDGVCDIVMVSDNSRTVFGWFGDYFSSPIQRWSLPDQAAIQSADAVGIDPYFPIASDRAVAHCIDAETPYVTIDSPYDSNIAKHCTAIALSNEYLQSQYPQQAHHQLMALYTRHTNGLVVFTFGDGNILYSRKGMMIQSMPTFDVPVRSTLGAGDTFRAGLIHGIATGLTDEAIIRFAAATAACAIQNMPLAEHPPSMAAIQTLLKNQQPAITTVSNRS